MRVSRDTYCNCLYYSATALARKLTRMAEEEFRPTGVAPSYGFVLMSVNQQPGITAGEIAGIMQLRPSTVTRLVDKLEEGRYLRRQAEGKLMRVFPMQRSVKLDGRLRAAWRGLYRRYTETLGERPSKELTSAVHLASSVLEA